ncbi:GntR family transcriptional regulator [Marinicella rhabdoformis]|uniref:GntR family transcriptional regulator n=1 Tax=Marinicella rhabdoformis TaxID=2580566 RepID=UPI0012AEBD27|nr:GntR family transcriptional regulator [Marinicella rhabdoformis]
MKITVDIESTVPMFTQLMMQIKQAVQKGQLKAGDPLPSIRQLANDLEVNSKTVAKAYRLLERDAVVQAKGYRGSFIHPDALANCTFDVNAWANEQATEMVTALRKAGVTDPEIRIAFTNALNKPLGE